MAACLVYRLWLEDTVLFSCKITHSVISLLDKRGEDLEALYEKCDWPAEFLRDPSSWLEADKMETLLRQIDADYGRDVSGEEGLIVQVGHQSKDLRAWGVLDSVLRMVQTPKDLFSQPERFLSYFISPAPPIGEVTRSHDSVSFVLPVSEMQFPMVTSYLRAALEALPTYISKPMASVTWDNSRVVIKWSENQASLFGEAQGQDDLSLNPELVRNILLSLEMSQKDLEEMKRALHGKDQEIERLRREAGPTLRQSLGAQKSSPAAIEKLDSSLHELFRLGDYIARAQQLITLLVGQGRQTPQVTEAMRRVDWDHVSIAGPQLVRALVSEIQNLKEDLTRVESTRVSDSRSVNLGFEGIVRDTSH